MASTNRVLLPLFLLVFFSYAAFVQSPRGQNVSSRMFLVLSLLEDGQITIDKFQHLTIDKASVNGRYYSDKAPGMAFMALPVAALSRVALQIAGRSSAALGADGQFTESYYYITYACQVMTSGVSSALLVLAIYVAAVSLGASRLGAVFAALVCGLGTPLWGWATAFTGHATAASLLFVGFAGVVDLLRRKESPKHDRRVGFMVGACLTWAFVVEYTAAPASGLILLYGLFEARRWSWARLGRAAAPAAAGCLVCVAPLLLYNRAAFGSVMSIGYQNMVGFEGMSEGFFGIRVPDVTILWELLLGQYRGLMWLSPVLLAVLPALTFMAVDRDYRALSVLIVAIVSYYLLMNAGYFMWHGGWSTGPRHITPILPFVALTIAILWMKTGRAVRTGLAGLALVSGVISLVCVATTMTAPEKYAKPLQDYLIPSFIDWLRDGRPPLGREATTVVLFELGLPPVLSLTVLVTLWGICGYFVGRGVSERMAPA
jgi:hypothetical protein